jgi:hypothetical protein
MKTKMVWLALLMIAVWIPLSSMAGGPSRMLTQRQRDLIELNLLRNLQCNCPQMYVGQVNTLIELKKQYPQYDFDFAIIPLMTRLKNSACPEERIISALALSYFDSAIARFAIVRRGLYDDSERVAKVCQAIERSWEKS